MRVLSYIAKAITAFLTVMIGSGVLTGQWLTGAEFVFGVLSSLAVYAVPNTTGVVTGGSTPTVTR